MIFRTFEFWISFETNVNVRGRFDFSIFEIERNMEEGGVEHNRFLVTECRENISRLIQ